eukprot:gnl/TRDRNA2_/TRDRNA2_162254_c0_seq4.p1 gnl/TRDRNA2_/TRDRNA2_162254_c0~~gnl/TRDRNA2_/TRDRNA2_162254_c0_seq4.p1  ORF type:complete len:163 (+),score=29.05 gnl/TRDRNA2_/TRDRNA2_162254_c0_seq4:645-1133(+)
MLGQESAMLGQYMANISDVGDSNACIYPPKEDPESWDCNCFEEMQERCALVAETPGYTIVNCLAAQYCMHEDICQSWASAVCSKSAVIAMQQALFALESPSQAPVDQLMAPLESNSIDRIANSLPSRIKTIGSAQVRLVQRSAVGTGMHDLESTMASAKRCK